MLSIFLLLLVFAVGYLLGSIPFGLLLTRAAGLGDVRTIGSGNIGATNVLRTGNKKIAVATLFLDGFKGYVAVMATLLLIAPMMLQAPQPPTIGSSGGIDFSPFVDYVTGIYKLAMTAGLGAFLGHVYPVWLGFKGGKGYATYIGVALALAWQVGLAICLVWLAVAAAKRYSSLATLTGGLAAPVVSLWLGLPYHALLFALMTALLFWTHRENIARLIAGTESRIGAKSKATGESA